jgi:hypothetical protein
MSKTGLDKIIQTYSRGGGDYTHLLQTLKMYRKMLERPDVFTEKSSNSINDKSSGIVNSEHYKEKKLENEKDKNIDDFYSTARKNK